jgi:hypothetical protein
MVKLVLFACSVIDLPETIMVEHVRVLCFKLYFIISKSM